MLYRGDGDGEGERERERDTHTHIYIYSNLEISILEILPSSDPHHETLL